jgi:hypothetical protein
MEQSKVIEFAEAYNRAAAVRKSIETFRAMEQRRGTSALWGYLDEDKQVVRCRMSDLLERCDGRDPFGPGETGRRVGRDIVRGRYLVSTVFLGIDHGHFGQSMWFETMVFSGAAGFSDDLHQERYETYEQALIGHERAVIDGVNRQGWARWLGYSRSHLRKIQREQSMRGKPAELSP